MLLCLNFFAVHVLFLELLYPFHLFVVYMLVQFFSDLKSELNCARDIIMHVYIQVQKR